MLPIYSFIGAHTLSGTLLWVRTDGGVDGVANVHSPQFLRSNRGEKHGTTDTKSRQQDHAQSSVATIAARQQHQAIPERRGYKKG